ncbi:hypothetical protein [Bacillus altitudinis]|uniref:hypothetical protein n=1 Tax=Bacillus altitudinis TaxID=293387 RepID=UPI0033969D5A
MAEKQEGQRIQRFLELDTIIDMVNWWIVWILLRKKIVFPFNKKQLLSILNKKG